MSFSVWNNVKVLKNGILVLISYVKLINDVKLRDWKGNYFETRLAAADYSKMLCLLLTTISWYTAIWKPFP